MKRGNHAPRAGENEEEKRESRAERGMRVKRSKHAPRVGKSEEEKRESRAERGMGE